MKKYILNASLVVFCFVSVSFGATPRLLHPGLDFSLTPDQIALQCKASLARVEGRLNDLVTLETSRRSFDNTVVALDQVLTDLGDELSGATFLTYVSTDEKVRNAGHDCETKLETFTEADVYAREPLYKAVKSVADGVILTAPEDKKLLKKILLAFKENGLELSLKKREEVKKLKTRLVDYELTFSKNLNEVKDYLLLNKEELGGLPQDFVDRLEKVGNQYKVTLDYPDYFPFMRNAKNVEARQKLEFKYNDRASKENLKILKKILKLRRQIASLLSYPTHAHYVLEDRMAKDPAKVFEFLNRLQKRIKEKADPELALLTELKAKDNPKDPVLRGWDFGYYDNFLKKTKYDVDDELVKEYFPVEVVTKGLLKIYQELLDLRFEEVHDIPLWHPDVKLYAVYDKSDGRLMGHFCMDLFPREGKYKHAAAFSLIGGRRLPDGSYQRPVSSIVANFNKPTQDRPSLLKHDEVETYFHEFGHIMHQVLTQAKYGRFSGSSVARDFVEAPSQMLENWVWKAETLRSLSGHYKDHSKKLPQDLLDRMIAAKNLNSGVRYLTQVFYATIDMTYHTQEKVKNTTDLYGRLKQEIVMIPMTPKTHPEASFGHLMGYDAAYYGYLWSEVFAQDMFARFEKEGLLNPKVGREYRQVILEPGGSLDEGEQLKKFLGRDPNEDAFLKNIGLEVKSNP